MRLIHRLLVSLAAVVVVSRTPPSYYWAGKNGDALRTGASSYVAPSDLSAGPTWSFQASDGALSRSHPLIDDQLNVYYAIVADSTNPLTTRGAIYKFSKTGEQLWNYTTTHVAEQLPNGPSLHDGRVLFLTSFGHVGALDMETGTELWNVKVGIEGTPDTSSMTAAEGYVIAPVRTNDTLEIPCPGSGNVSPPGGPGTQLVALNMSGHVLWRFNPDTGIYNSLNAIVDGSVVFSDLNGRTYRLELATGRVLWKHEAADYRNCTGFSTGGAIVGPNRVVYTTSNVGTFDTQSATHGGRISAYALETGQLLWRQDTEFTANNAAAVGPIGPNGDGPLAVVIVIGQNPDSVDIDYQPRDKDGIAIAFDAATGERLAWQHKLHWAGGVAAGDTLVPFHTCLPDDASNPAIGGDGTVYFGFEDGRLYALRDADGDGLLSDDEVSYHDGGHAYQGSPGIAPGMLVACSCNSLHVYNSEAPPSTASLAPSEVTV